MPDKSFEKPQITPLTFHATVETPYGRGIVQGLMRKPTGDEVLVSHDPHLPTLPEMIKSAYAGGIWVLWSYPADQLTVVAQ